MRHDVPRWLRELMHTLEQAASEPDAPGGDIQWLVLRSRDTLRMAGELQTSSLRHLVKSLAELLRSYPRSIPEALLRAAITAPGDAFPFALLRVEAFALGLPEAPRWDAVTIGPPLALSAAQKARVARADLVTADAFEERFTQLLSLGYPWISLSASGVLSGALLVTVDAPTCTQAEVDRTAINVSGPAAFVRQRAGWYIDDLVSIEGTPP